jgi:hypothetical protein
MMASWRMALGSSSMLGRGGFEKVYDGFLEDGTQVAVNTGREVDFSPSWFRVLISQVQPGLKFGDKRPPLVPVEPTRTKGSFSPGWYYELRLGGHASTCAHPL